jgi:hypothetical protein
MRRQGQLIIAALAVLLIGFVWCVYALFHGKFDHGSFEVAQTDSFSSTQLAVVAKRSDHEALSGDQYFVVIGDHPLSAANLKRAYYHDGVVFRAGSTCLSVRWASAHELIVSCGDHSIRADQIAVRRTQIGDVMVSYEGIPPMEKN